MCNVCIRNGLWRRAEKTLSRWVSHTHTHTTLLYTQVVLYILYVIIIICVCDSFPRHTYVSGELIARGGDSHCHSSRRVPACSCVCVLAPGMGPEINELVTRAVCTPVAVVSVYIISCMYYRRQKPHPGVCCHWLIRHDT